MNRKSPDDISYRDVRNQLISVLDGLSVGLFDKITGNIVQEKKEDLTKKLPNNTFVNQKSNQSIDNSKRNSQINRYGLEKFKYNNKPLHLILKDLNNQIHS